MLKMPDDLADAMNEHYRKLERAYASAPINRFYAPTALISREKAVITFDVGVKSHHAAHAVHDSVCFKALDDAAFFAEAELTDQEGNQIARGSGTFTRSKIPLTPEIGYQ